MKGKNAVIQMYFSSFSPCKCSFLLVSVFGYMQGASWCQTEKVHYLESLVYVHIQTVTFINDFKVTVECTKYCCLLFVAVPFSVLLLVFNTSWLCIYFFYHLDWVSFKRSFVFLTVKFTFSS